MTDTSNVSEFEHERLVRSLVSSSSCDNHRQLIEYYKRLSPEGWYVECGRTHLRLNHVAPLPHQVYAEFLGLGLANAYREVVQSGCAMRSALIDMSRKAFTLQGPYVLTELSRTPEYLEWNRQIGIDRSYRLRNRGRNISEVYARTERGKQIERLRVSCQITLKRWARKIGTSENTYRTHLSFGDVPTDWLASAETLALSASGVSMKPAWKDVVLTSGDALHAFTTVWQSFNRSKDTVREGKPAPLPGDEQNVDLTQTFEPSEETELEGFNGDEGDGAEA